MNQFKHHWYEKSDRIGHFLNIRRDDYEMPFFSVEMNTSRSVEQNFINQVDVYAVKQNGLKFIAGEARHR